MVQMALGESHMTFKYYSMGDLQDPIHGGTLVPYFVGIFPYIGLKNRPYIGLIYSRYLQSIGS